MAFSWVTPVRGAQLLCSIIVLGTAGYLVSGAPDSSRAAFNVFTAVWTLLVSAFFLVTGLVMSESFLSNPIIAIAVDGLSWIFWLAAFACLAAILDDVESYLPPGFNSTPLGTLKATVAFGVIEWLLFTATLVWNAMSGFRGKSTGGGAPAHQGV